MSPELKLLNKELAKIEKEYKAQFKLFRKYKRYTQYSRVIVNVLNGITVSSVVLSFSGALPILAVTIASSTMSSLTSIVSESCNWNGKMYQSQQTYLQLKELHNQYKIQSLHKEVDHTELLKNLTEKLALVADSALPVSVSSISKSKSHS